MSGSLKVNMIYFHENCFCMNNRSSSLWVICNRNRSVNNSIKTFHGKMNANRYQHFNVNTLFKKMIYSSFLIRTKTKLIYSVCDWKIDIRNKRKQVNYTKIVSKNPLYVAFAVDSKNTLYKHVITCKRKLSLQSTDFVKFLFSTFSLCIWPCH